MSDHGQHLRIVEHDVEDDIRMLAGTLALSALIELRDNVWPVYEDMRHLRFRDKVQDGIEAVICGAFMDMAREPHERDGRADALDHVGLRLREKATAGLRGVA